MVDREDVERKVDDLRCKVQRAWAQNDIPRWSDLKRKLDEAEAELRRLK